MWYMMFASWMPLHSWDKSYLLVAYAPFNMLLDLICLYFTEDFCICVHKGFVVFMWFFLWLWNWCRLTLKSKQKVFPSHFLPSLRIGVNSSWMSGRIYQWSPQAWAFLCWAVLDYWFNFLTCSWSIQIFHFFLSQTGSWCVSRNCSFHLGYLIFWCTNVHGFSYHLSDFYKVGSPHFHFWFS